MTKRVALITGSGRRRVGAHVADALADRGYSLAIHYRTAEEEAREAVERYRRSGTEAHLFQADLTEEQAVDELVGETITQLGRLDVLVNCAAIWKSGRLEDIRAADVRAHWEANALASFLCSRRAGLEMVKQPEGGCIILFGDWAEVRPYLHYAAYFASKGAIPTMTRTLAVELGSRNPRVRVNCILPGPAMLPSDLPATERQQAIDATLVQREGTPQHLARAVLHFIENDFITGACLPVDGGRTVFSNDSR